MVSTTTSARTVWKNQVHTAPGRMRKAWRPRGPAGSGTVRSEVTWQTVRDSGSTR
jgi:hypothetical protein